MDVRTDLQGRPLYVGDVVIMGRPAGGYRSTGARLDIVKIVRFTKTGVTTKSLVSLNDGEFNSPYRANKFLKVDVNVNEVDNPI